MQVGCAERKQGEVGLLGQLVLVGFWREVSCDLSCRCFKVVHFSEREHLNRKPRSNEDLILKSCQVMVCFDVLW